jgi:hypothetical protein
MVVVAFACYAVVMVWLLVLCCGVVGSGAAVVGRWCGWLVGWDGSFFLNYYN